MRGLTLLGRLALGFALLATGCAGPPREELQQAKAAVQRARADGAETFAPAQYKAAVTALRAAQQAADRRDYRQALALAVDSRTRAREAARMAVEQRAVARDEAIRGIEDLQAAVNEARRRIASGETPGARITREQRLAVSETRRAIVVANVALQKARTALADSQFGAARDAVRGVADHLKAISEAKPAGPAQAGRGAPR